MAYQPIEVSVEKAKEIIKKRTPRGFFWTLDNGIYVGIDNTTGDAWTEDFPSLEMCLSWLT